jgi:DNA-binding transcriptional LysR family regulator
MWRCGRVANPITPDNVVRPYFKLRSTLFAHQRYVERRGLPADEGALGDHEFVTVEDPRAARFFGWLEDTAPAESIVLRSSDHRVLREAIAAGMGIGFAPCFEARRDGALREVLEPREAWEVPFWLVTHVDLYRSAKVQALLKVLREVGDEEADAGGVARAT